MIILFENFVGQDWDQLVKLIFTGRAAEVSGIGGESYIFSKMKKLFKTKPALINSIYENTKPILVVATERGFERFVKFLIENGADVNKADQFNVGALHEAAKNKDYDIVKLLLDSGADPKITAKGGLTPSIAVFNEGINEHNVEKVLDILELIYNAGGNFLARDVNGYDVWAMIKSHNKQFSMLQIRFESRFPDVMKQIAKRDRQERFDL